MSETYTDPDKIGDYLSIYADEGDVITVKTPQRVFIATILETPNDVPVRDHQTKEITCETAADEPIICLYAYVRELTQNRIQYDVYAVEIPLEEDATELGEIQEISLTEKHN
jgi:hypothetical protein